MVEDCKQYFNNITFEQIPIMQNKAANAMAIVGSLLYMPNNEIQFKFIVEQFMVPVYEIPSLEYVCVTVCPKSPWYNEIYTYLHNQYMSPNLSSNQKKTLIHQASRNTIIADTLYRKILDGTLLRCLNF